MQTDLATEGPGDALTSIAQNTGAILIRGAALANNEETIQQLLNATQHRRVVLAGDNDMSGVDFNLTLGSELANHGRQVHTLEISEGGDLTEWREIAGERFPSDFQRGLRQAQRISAIGASPPHPLKKKRTFDFEDPLITFKMTDQGNALRLASQIENDWIYHRLSWLASLQQGAWLESNGLINLEVARMLQTTQDIAAGMIEASDHLVDEEAELMRELGGRLFRWAHNSENNPRFQTIAKRAEDILRVDYEALDSEQTSSRLCKWNCRSSNWRTP
jgi:hypothetical protein